MTGILQDWEPGQFPDGIQSMPTTSRDLVNQVREDLKKAYSSLHDESQPKRALEHLHFALKLMVQVERECSQGAAWFAQQDIEQTKVRIDDCMYDLIQPNLDEEDIADIIEDILFDLNAIVGSDNVKGEAEY